MKKELKKLSKKMVEMKEKFKHICLSKKSKVALLTHTDMDGSGSAIFLRYVFKQIAFIKHLTNYSMDKGILETILDEELMENIDVLFITDISCSIETATIIEKSKYSKKIVLLDHHGTAKELNNFSFAFVVDSCDVSFNTLFYPNNSTIKTSGTTLMLDFLLSKDFIPKSTKVLELAHTIGAYDNWDWVNVFEKNKKYSNLNTLFQIYEQRRFEDVFVEKLKNNEKLFGKTEVLLLELEESKIENYVYKTSKLFDTFNISIEGREYFAIFANADRYYMEVFDKMMELYPTAELLIVNNNGKISLRTRKDNIDVSVIAKSVGGGGHTQAAGFSLFDESKSSFFSLLETKLNATISFIQEK